MPSPFPGMDPYIESSGVWEDFHHNLIGEIQNAVAAKLPANYVARAGERSYVVLFSAEESDLVWHAMQSDVGITQPAESAPATARASIASAAGTATDDQPVTMHAFVEAEFREAFIEISTLSPERKLVTTIEVLSPSNKRPGTEGWRQYLRKRQGHLEREANLVEIDLLRGGQRMPMIEEWPASPYYVLTCWKRSAPACKVWPAFFDRPLPKLRVPLTPPDVDLTLDLQPMVDSIYDRSRYVVDIDYRRPCRPALDERTIFWLSERLSQRS
jgi:hypothetical protein